MKKILGIGNALVDIMTVIDDDRILEKFSLPKASMQLVDSEKSEIIKKGTVGYNKTMSSGGSAANTIHGLAMLGVETGFVGTVGNDETGDFFEKDMKEAGVKTFLSRRSTATGTAVVLISPDSERTFATHLGAAIELSANDIDPTIFKDHEILYLEGYLIANRPLFEKACKIAHDNKMKIALDLASYNIVESNIDYFKEIINKYIDIVFANEDEAKAFTGSLPLEALNSISQSCNIAIVKAGKEGSYIKQGEEIIKIGSINARSIDTTGAGDLYAAGFLYGYANNLPLEKCGLIGSVLAGNVIEVLGAKMDNNRWKTIHNVITDINNAE
jgi:sugar/nucleoside kinase (ribokinase family)